MITEAHYKQYVSDFNAACVGDGTAFSAFYDTYYVPDAVFEYLPNATKNVGKEMTVSFWQKVHDIMQEEMKDHRSLVISDTTVAVEAPIDFLCKKDLEWVGAPPGRLWLGNTSQSSSPIPATVNCWFMLLSSLHAVSLDISLRFAKLIGLRTARLARR